MNRPLVLVLVVFVAFACSAAAVQAGRADPVTASGQSLKCKGIAAKLGGKSVCLAAGRSCQLALEPAYEKYGFTCAGGLLYVKSIVPNARVLATIPVGVQPSAIRYLDGAIWVKNLADGTVSRIDPTTNSVVATIQVGTGFGDLAYGDGSIWVPSESTNAVSRIDPNTNTVVATIPTGIRPLGVAWTPGAIWVGNHGHDPSQKATVVRIDTATNQVVWQAGVGVVNGDVTGGPDQMTVAFGSVWVQVPNGTQLDRINPSDNTITSITTDNCDGEPEAMNGLLWLSGCGNDVFRVDPATNAVTQIAPGGGPIFIIAVDGAFLWASTDHHLLLKIDPTTSKVVGSWHAPGARLYGGGALITAGAGSIWLADTAGNRVLRLQP